MSVHTTMPESPTSLRDVEHHLTSLKLPFIAGQYAELGQARGPERVVSP